MADDPHAMTGAFVNHLYFGDNLDVLRESVADASVDLAYLVPSFNSKRKKPRM